jgi:hypothetical protein
MMVPVSESRAHDVRPLRPSDNLPSSDRATRLPRFRPTWHLVIFPVGCAALARSVLHLVTDSAGLALTCTVYAAAVLIGLSLTAAMERVSNPEIARGTSGIVGSVAFAISSYLSHDLEGACVLLVVYVFSAVVSRTTATGNRATHPRRPNRHPISPRPEARTKPGEQLVPF